MANARLIFDTCDNLRASSTGSLILRQFRLYNAATPLEVGPLLSTLHNRPPSSNSASSVLVFLLSLRFPSITVLRSESPLRTCPITFLSLFYRPTEIRLWFRFRRRKLANGLFRHSFGFGRRQQVTFRFSFGFGRN